VLEPEATLPFTGSGPGCEFFLSCLFGQGDCVIEPSGSKRHLLASLTTELCDCLLESFGGRIEVDVVQAFEGRRDRRDQLFNT
jgi:hypothetical protein